MLGKYIPIADKSSIALSGSLCERCSAFFSSSSILSFPNKLRMLIALLNRIRVLTLRFFVQAQCHRIRHTEGRLEQDSSNRCHAMIHHQNADAMVLASARLRGIPPWTSAILNIIRGVNASQTRTG
jgi:hypothetical protein